MRAKQSISGQAVEQRNRLEALLMHFEQDWRPGLLDEFVARVESDAAGVDRRLALAELVKIDLQRGWISGHGKLIEQYLTEFPALGTAADVDPELLAVEYCARRETDPELKLSSYRERFPGRADDLSRLVGEADQSGAGQPATIDTSRISEARDTSPRGKTVSPEIPREFGRYRIIRELGSGAMGTVYLAHDTQLDRQVALKTPKFKGGEDAELIARFYREARAAATLHHRNICPIHDVGQIDGQHYMSIGFIKGRSLQEFIKSDRLPPPKTVAMLIHRLALALAEAHRHNVIHRDLKPANIMIDHKREPIVMDFGLARKTDTETRMTQSGMLVGTPAYMSPEQVTTESDEVGPAADIYALGVILYELLTGDIPFRGSIAQVVYQITSEEPKPPSEIRDGIDPALESICAKMMAKRVEDRYRSMEEVAADLKAYLKGKPNQIARKAEQSSTGDSGEVSETNALNAYFAAQAAADPMQTALEPALASKPAPRRRPRKQDKPSKPQKPRGLWIGAGLAGLLILLGIVFLWPTPEGTVRVEVLGDGLEDLDVLIDGDAIDIKNGKWEGEETAEEHRLALRLGGDQLRFDEETKRFEIDGRELSVKLAGAEISSDRFDVVKDGETLLTIAFVRSELDSTPDWNADEPEVVDQGPIVQVARKVLAHPSSDPDDPSSISLREELQLLRVKYVGQPEANQVAQLMTAVPWPLDSRQQSDLTEAQLMNAGAGDTAAVPEALVAMCGGTTSTHWWPPSMLAVSSEGRLAATADAGIVCLWDLETGALQHRLFTSRLNITQIALSPDGRFLAAVGSGVAIWDAASGRSLHLLTERFPGTISCCAFTASSDQLIVGGRRYLGVVDAVSGDAAKLDSSDESYDLVTVASHGEVFAAVNAEQGKITIWDIDEQREIHTLRPAPESSIVDVAFDRDGHQLAMSDDRRIELWNISEPEPTVATLFELSDGESVYDDGPLVFGDAGVLYAVRRGRVSGYSLATGEWTELTNDSDAAPLALGFCHGTSQLVILARSFGQARGHHLQVRAAGHTDQDSAGAAIELLPTGLLPQTLSNPFPAVDISGDATMLAVLDGGSRLTLHSVSGAWAPRVIAEPLGTQGLVAFRPSAPEVAALDNLSGIQVWEIRRDGRPRIKWKKPIKPIRGQSFPQNLAYTAGGRLLAASDTNGVHVFDASSGAPPSGTTEFQDELQQFAVSPDGSLLVVSTQGPELVAWDRSTGRETWSGTLDPGRTIRNPLRNLEFRADGTEVMALNRFLYFIDPTDGTVLEKIDPRFLVSRGVLPNYRMATSSDGRWIAFVSYVWGEGVLHLVDWASRTHRKTIRFGPVMLGRHDVAFAPDSRHVIVANLNGSAYVFRIETLDEARTRVERSFQAGEFGVGSGKATPIVEFEPSGNDREPPRQAPSQNQSDAASPTSAPQTDASARQGRTDGAPTPVNAPFVRNLRSAVFTPEGRILGWTTDRRLIVVAHETGQTLRELETRGPTADLSAGRLAVSPDGRYACSSWEQDAANQASYLWDLRSGEFLNELELGRGAAFSPDGEMIVTYSWNIGGGGSLRLYETATGRLVARPENLTGSIHGVAFTPDGRKLIIGVLEDSVRMLNLDTLETTERVVDLEKTSCLTVTPDGQSAVVGGFNYNVYRWDFETSKPPLRLFRSDTSVSRLALHPDGRSVVVGGYAGVLRLIELNTGDVLWTVQAHEHEIASVDISPDGRFCLSAGSHGNKESRLHPYVVRLWRLPEDVPSETSDDDVSQFAPAPPTDDAAAPQDGRIGDDAPPGEVFVLDPPDEKINRCSISPDGRWIVSIERDGGRTARLWSSRDGRQVASWSGHHSYVGWLPDSRRMVCIDRPYVRVRTVDDPSRILAQWNTLDAGIKHVDVSPDGRRALVSSWSRAYSLWDLETGERLRTIEDLPVRVDTVAFGGDGERIQCYGPDVNAPGGATIEVRNASSGEILKSIREEYGSEFARFSSDGNRILIPHWNSSRVTLIDTITGAELAEWTTPSQVSSVALSTKGVYALTGGNDGVVRLYDTDPPRILHVFRGHTDQVNWLEFSADLRFAVSAGEDGTLRVWRLPTGLLQRAPQPGDAGNGLLSENRIEPASTADEWIDLFNGRDLTGWELADSNKSAWSVQDGAIVVEGRGRGYLHRDWRFSDFEMTLEYRDDGRSDRGFVLRAPDAQLGEAKAMELTIIDNDSVEHTRLMQDGGLHENPVLLDDAARAAGEWNTLRVRVDGSVWQVWLNRELMVEIDRRPQQQANQRHTAFTRTAGRVVLQHWDSKRVEFRNIRVRELEPGASDPRTDDANKPGGTGGGRTKRGGGGFGGGGFGGGGGGKAKPNRANRNRK